MTYSNWDESKHPRDNEGKFTYKNGGSSSHSSTIKMIEEQNRKIKEFERAAEILYPTMKKGRTYQTPPFAPKQQYDYKKEENPKNPEDILYPTMKTKGEIAPNSQPIMKYMNTQLGGDIQNKTEQRTPTGSAADITDKHSPINEIAVDNIDNPMLRTGAKIVYGNEATENLLMSKADLYMNTDYAKKHFIFNNCQELSKDLRNYFEEKISSQIGSDKIKDTKGIFIDTNSASSQRMSDELVKNQDFIQKAFELKDKMNAGNKVNTTVQFTDRNFHNAVGKADVRDMHIDKNGNLNLLVTDVYDFNKNDKSDLVQVARERQDRGEIKPYFTIYHVIIPKGKLK